MVRQIKTKPKKYQVEGAKQIHKWGGTALLADEMGLGKTFTSLYYIYKTKRNPVVVVCPSSVKSVWKEEAFKHFGMSAEVCEGRKPPPIGGSLVPHPPIIVINYHILVYWANYIEKCIKPELIIYDEIHNLANRTTGWTKAALKLSKKIPHRIGLTGTPMTNTPKNLWPILNILHPKSFPSFPKFAWRYCAPKKAPWGWVYDGANNRKELRQILLDGIMIRRKKTDVLKELPPKTKQVIPITLPPKKRKEYIQAEEEFIEWVRINYGENKAKRAKKAEAVSKMTALRMLTAKLKFRQCIDWVKEFLEYTDEKIILFVHHKQAVKALQKHFNGQSVTLSGATKVEERSTVMRKFQNDPKTRVFIGTLAAREGITLHAASSIAFLELWPVPGWINQAEDRAHRIGQKKNVNIFFILASNTVEEKQAKLVQRKNRIQEEIVDGKEGGYDLDISEELIKAIRDGKL